MFELCNRFKFNKTIAFKTITKICWFWDYDNAMMKNSKKYVFKNKLGGK